MCAHPRSTRVLNRQCAAGNNQGGRTQRMSRLSIPMPNAVVAKTTRMWPESKRACTLARSGLLISALYAPTCTCHVVHSANLRFPVAERKAMAVTTEQLCLHLSVGAQLCIGHCTRSTCHTAGRMASTQEATLLPYTLLRSRVGTKTCTNLYCAQK